MSERCEKTVACFKKAMDDYNSVKGQPFRINIASGYAVYDKLQENEMLMDYTSRRTTACMKIKNRLKQNIR